MINVKMERAYNVSKGAFYDLFNNSWSGAIQTLEDIIRNELELEFMEYLDSLCDYEWDYEEVTDTELNDFIWFERDTIYDALGLDENGDLIK